MKRIVSLLLCLIMACGMLVGCAEDEIGDHVQDLKDKFYVAPEEKITLKLYVVYDEADEGARTEVERRVNALTEADYNTQLDVVYLKAEEYDEQVMKAAADGEQAIVLINSEELMMKLYDGGEEVVVTELYDPALASADAPVVKVVTTYGASGSTVTKYDAAGNVVKGTENDDKKIPISKQVSVGYLEEVGTYILPQATGDAKYGLLNAKIATSLLNASKLSYNVLDEKTGETVTASGLFSVPNNHLIDATTAYTYLKIDRQACEIWLNHSVDYLRGVTSIAEIDALKAELREVLIANGQDPAKADEYVKLVRGNFADKAIGEANEKFVMNILATPETTAEDAFSGAFAILKGTDVDRAMRILYALNMDTDLRNLLQYGIKDTNYLLKEVKDEAGNVLYETIERFGDEVEGKKYHMNPLYTGGVFKMTGNVFNTLYCEAENWTPEVAAYIEDQNKVADQEYAKAVAAEQAYLALVEAAADGTPETEYALEVATLEREVAALEIDAARKCAIAAELNTEEAIAAAETAKEALADAKAELEATIKPEVEA